MKAVYIRHKLDSTREILEDLWTRRLIAVHYADIRSTDPKEYDGPGRTALTNLWQYCESGAVVGASYRSIRPGAMIVGEIISGSRVELREYGGRIYKTVRLRNAREVSYLDDILLAAIQPRQGTVTGWPSAQKYLEAVLKGRKIPCRVGSLAPCQLEVICYEYLRLKGILEALLMPIGRSLRDIDIYGISERGEGVIAQVTHSGQRRTIRGKLGRLKEYQSADTKLVFFGPESARFHDADVQYISIESAFDWLSCVDSNPIHHRMIRKMLRWPKVGD